MKKSIAILAFFAFSNAALSQTAQLSASPIPENAENAFVTTVVSPAQKFLTSF